MVAVVGVACPGPEFSKVGNYDIHIYIWTPTPITLPCLLACTGNNCNSMHLGRKKRKEVEIYFYDEMIKKLHEF